MSKAPDSIGADDLRLLYNVKRGAIRSRLDEFKRVAPPDYFYELVYCLLTPQSSAVNAGRAVELLRRHDFQTAEVDPAPLLHQKEFYIRFHRTKAKHLVAAKRQFGIIAQHLANGSSPAELRSWLVENVTGLGWKEASHFLRNIGYADLAILDRHILKNLVRTGVLRRLPKTMTRKRYLAIEGKFYKFAQQIDISMDELDLLFWSMETGEILK